MKIKKQILIPVSISILVTVSVLLFLQENKAKNDSLDNSSLKDKSITPLAEKGSNSKIKKTETKVPKKKSISRVKKSQDKNLRTTQEDGQNSKITNHEIKGRLFILKLKQDIHKFSDSELLKMRDRLIESDKADPADFALEFITSSNKKTKEFGLNLLQEISIQRTESFKPNEFFKAFAKEGLDIAPYLSKIIRNTNDDFIREWACELWADIYFHNSKPTDSRHLKIAECKKDEMNVYNFIQELLSKPDELEEVIQKKGPLGDIIIDEWGTENRMPLKMIALISIFDLMNTQNRPVCSSQALKIIKTYNFNYDILGRLNGQSIDRPPLPQEVVLKKLSDAVFKNQFTDTYQWLSKANGGFTNDELSTAVATKNTLKMRKMLTGFRIIITEILRAKLLIGMGQNEIKQLRYFYQKTWNNKPFEWTNKMLILNNNSSTSALFLISDKSSKEKPIEFLIPSRTQFIWFLPEGDYNLKSSPKSYIGFLPKTIKIKDQSITVDM